jgi:hypothetical protein
VRDDRVDPFHELVRVVLRHRLAAATELDVRMRVDDAGHDGHPLGVDHAVGRLRRLPFARNRAAGEFGRPRCLNRDDGVALDEDVERPARRIAGAVDDVRILDEQTAIALAA